MQCKSSPSSSSRHPEKDKPDAQEDHPLMEATCYRGVRKRKWGKWVSEIREPGKKTRIWLGSFEAPEMAAAAYDVAAYALRGRDAQLNFPELVDEFPRPMSAEPEEIRSAAIEAAARMRMRTEVVVRGEAGGGGGGGGGGGVAALKRLSQGLWCEELGLESPKMWAELAEALLIAPPVVAEEEVKEEVEQGWLWNL